MLRRKLGPRMGDLRLLRARLVPIWCKSLTAKARVRERRPSRSLLLLLRRKSLRKVKAVLCVDLLIIGQRSAHTAKEESLHLSRRM
jgi:hypothetical protein